MQTQLSDLVTDLADHAVDGRPVLEDPTTLRRLGEIAVRINYLEVLCKRSISAILHGGDAFGSASLAKSVWGEVGQDIAALAFDVIGTAPTAGRWTDYRLTSRSLTIAGGTTQINKGITAQRVLGSAAHMNLELTDEQMALRDTVRRFLAEKAASPAMSARCSTTRPAPPTRCGAGSPHWGHRAARPTEYGGAGMTMVEAGIVAEELGAGLHPGPWLSSAVAAPRALTRFGGRRRWRSALQASPTAPRSRRSARWSGPRPAARRVTATASLLRGEITACRTPPPPTCCSCWPTTPTARVFSRSIPSSPGCR